MNATAVVSCPGCLRQYEIGPSAERVVAQCGACKASFRLIIPEDGSELILDDEVPGDISGLQEACREFMTHSIVWMDGEQGYDTFDSVRTFAMHATSERIIQGCRRWSEANQEACDTQSAALSPSAQAANYFMHRFHRLNPQMRLIIREAYLGLITGLERASKDET